MAIRITNYEIGDLLKAEGFMVASNPFESARQGNRVIVLASTNQAADMCQRGFYKKLAGTKIEFTAKKWKIYFKNGGQLEIYTPSSIDSTSFSNLDRGKTFYSLYRD